MADTFENRIESALKTIENTADSSSGYLKKENREDLRKAVSEIRKCFVEMKVVLEDNSREIENAANTAKEVKSVQSEGDLQRGDRWLMRQVVPSPDPEDQLENEHQHLVASDGQPDKSTLASREQSAAAEPSEQGGRTEPANVILQPPSPSGKTSLYMDFNEIQEKVTTKVTKKLTNMLEALTNSMQDMIKKEIESIQHQAMNPRQKPSKADSNSNLNAGNRDPPPRIGGAEQVGLLYTDEEDNREAAVTLGGKNDAEEVSAAHVVDTQDEENWTRYHSRRRQRQEKVPIIGSKEGDDNDLRPADRTAWLYVGKVKHGTTEESIRNFLLKNNIKEGITCEKLTTKGSMEAFRVGIPFKHLTEAEKPEFWPKGILVRRYLFRGHRRTEGAAFE